jgi:hypothetical protein
MQVASPGQRESLCTPTNRMLTSAPVTLALSPGARTKFSSSRAVGLEGLQAIAIVTSRPTNSQRMASILRESARPQLEHWSAARMLHFAECSLRRGQGAAMTENQPPETRKTDEPVRNQDVERDSNKSPEPVEDVSEEAEDDDRFQATDN